MCACGKRHNLGLISTAAIAAAPAFGPAAPLIIAGALIASFLPFKGMIGQGRTEADYLTRPQTGAQWKIEHEGLPAIIDPYTQMKVAGTLTNEYLANTETALERIRDEFVSYAQGFSKAGQGAIQTILHVINDILLPDVRAQYATIVDTTTVPSLPVLPAPSLPILPAFVPTIYNAVTDYSWLWLLALGFIVSR